MSGTCGGGSVAAQALVAAGRMSLVGPRPITRFELNEHYYPDAMEVLAVRPGLTGLWQVRGRSRMWIHASTYMLETKKGRSMPVPAQPGDLHPCCLRSRPRSTGSA